mgnify:CR=1 FL=1
MSQLVLLVQLDLLDQIYPLVRLVRLGQQAPVGPADQPDPAFRNRTADLG